MYNIFSNSTPTNFRGSRPILTRNAIRCPESKKHCTTNTRHKKSNRKQEKHKNQNKHACDQVKHDKLIQAMARVDIPDKTTNFNASIRRISCDTSSNSRTPMQRETHFLQANRDLRAATLQHVRFTKHASVGANSRVMPSTTH